MRFSAKLSTQFGGNRNVTATPRKVPGPSSLGETGLRKGRRLLPEASGDDPSPAFVQIGEKSVSWIIIRFEAKQKLSKQVFSYRRSRRGLIGLLLRLPPTRTCSTLNGSCAAASAMRAARRSCRLNGRGARSAAIIGRTPLGHNLLTLSRLTRARGFGS
jgi:hypothetical protein